MEEPCTIETPSPARPRALTPALIGADLIVAGLVLSSGVDVLLPGQDRAGKGMAAGFLFFAGSLPGIAFLIAAAVRALRGRSRPG